MGALSLSFLFPVHWSWFLSFYQETPMNRYIQIHNQKASEWKKNYGSGIPELQITLLKESCNTRTEVTKDEIPSVNCKKCPSQHAGMNVALLAFPYRVTLKSERHSLQELQWLTRNPEQELQRESCHWYNISFVSLFLSMESWGYLPCPRAWNRRA